MRLLLVLTIAMYLQAATYYVSPTGSDGNSCATAQSSGSAKATFSSAWGCLTAGDTLIVRDGNYSQQIAPPQGKAGVAGSVITVRAENDGAAKITLPSVAYFVANSYITLQGLTIVGASNSGAISINSATGKGGSSATASHHLTLQRMGIRCPLTGSSVNDNVCLEVSSGAHHNVIEDSWIWGGGRYEVMAYGRDNNGETAVTGADYNVFRRLVIRQGPNVSGGGQPQAGIMMYYANNNTIENVIVVDSTPNSDSSNAAFYLSAHATPPSVSGNKYLGVLALNIQGKGSGIYFDTDNGGVSNNEEIRDSVVWNVAGEALPMYNQVPSNCTGIVVDHVTVGGGSSSGYGWSNCSATVTNSIFMNSRGTAIDKSSSAGSLVSNYNILYGNAKTYSNATAGANDLTSNPVMSYITRVESGTPGYRTASDGSNRGADLSRRYANGVKTAEALWPWPNETRIKKEMCTDSGITTGFCASSSLTNYVWGYLGKPVPADISGPGPAPIPTSPCDLTGDGVVNQQDVNAVVSQVLGEAVCRTADIQPNGTCNVVDLQRVINAAQGQSCNVTP